MRTSNRKGRLSKSAVVYSNDPKSPKTRISISCQVKEYISVSPHTRVSLAGFEGEKVEREVTITSLLPEPLKITEVTSDIDDKIKYKLKTEAKGKKYVLKIKNRSTKAGTFRGKIILKTDCKKKPQITLNVFSRLQKEVMVRPQALVFGTIDTTSGGNINAKMLSKKVTLRDMRGEGLEIKKIKTSEDWIITEKVKTKKGYTLTVTLDKEKLPKGEFSGEVEVFTNRKKKPLKIAVKGEIL